MKGRQAANVLGTSNVGNPGLGKLDPPSFVILSSLVLRANQSPPLFTDAQAGTASVLVVDGVHFLNRVKVADNKCRTERLARLDRPPSELLNHAHVSTLVTPGLIDDRRIERHTGQPRSLFTGIRISQTICGE